MFRHAAAVGMVAPVGEADWTSTDTARRASLADSVASAWTTNNLISAHAVGGARWTMRTSAEVRDDDRHCCGTG
jgi:hypothetical protein